MSNNVGITIILYTIHSMYCFVVDKRSVLDKLSLKTWGAPAPAREACLSMSYEKCASEPLSEKRRFLSQKKLWKIAVTFRHVPSAFTCVLLFDLSESCKYNTYVPLLPSPHEIKYSAVFFISWHFISFVCLIDTTQKFELDKMHGTKRLQLSYVWSIRQFELQYILTYAPGGDVRCDDWDWKRLVCSYISSNFSQDQI